MGEKENAMIASVNGEVITQSDLKKEVDNLLQQVRGRIPPDQVQEAMPHLQQQALDNLIVFVLLKQEGEREGIQPGDEMIENHITEIASRFPSPEAFKSQLEGQGVSEEEMRQDVKQNIKIQMLLDRQKVDIKDAGQEEIQAYYEEHPEEFKMKERVRASHILIKVDPTDNVDAKNDKRLKLSGLKGELEKGADFAELVGQHSQCPSNANGGDLGFFERGRMVKPFEDAAFTLKAGEVTDIVETQFGYHLIKVTELQPPRVIPLEEAKDQLAIVLRRKVEQKNIEEFILKLRQGADIKVAEGEKT